MSFVTSSTGPAMMVTAMAARWQYGKLPELHEALWHEAHMNI
jgi:hypothetical protein